MDCFPKVLVYIHTLENTMLLELCMLVNLAAFGVGILALPIRPN